MDLTQCPREMKVKLAITVLALVTLGGVSVAIADLKPTAPKNVDLTALWKINAELSDDPQKVLAKKRDEGSSGSRGSSGGGSPGAGVGDVFGGLIFGGVIFGGGSSGGRHGGGSDPPADDPTPPESMRMPLDSFLATREQFEIEQRSDTLTIRTYEETSTCKLGETTKVPMQSGELVDQRCGWQGAAFVMELVSPDGVTRVTRYELRNHNKQLVVLSQVKGGRGQLSGIKIKRVYDRLVAY